MSQDIVHWACTWSSQFEYVDTLLALEQWDVAQTTCFALQCAADDTEDAVTFDYAVAIKALTAMYVACGAPQTKLYRTFPPPLFRLTVTDLRTVMPSIVWDVFETSALSIQDPSEKDHGTTNSSC